MLYTKMLTKAEIEDTISFVFTIFVIDGILKLGVPRVLYPPGYAYAYPPVYHTMWMLHPVSFDC